jgi:diacylglycerol O-acyltransferase
VPISALRRAGHVAGGTLNDAFLGSVSGGLRRYHEAHGVPAGELMVSMPISTRTEGDPMGGNRATLMRFGIPADIDDAAQRIRVIHSRTTEVRKEKSLAHTEVIAAALNLMPSCYVGSALRDVDFIASDVPGASAPVFLAGAPVRMQYAFSPTMGAGLNVTLLSYLDTCAIGINVDVRAVPDHELLRRCVIAGFDETLELVSRDPS